MVADLAGVVTITNIWQTSEKNILHIITLLSVRDIKIKILPQKQIIPLCNAVVVMILHPCAVPPQHNEKFGGKENTM